MNNNKRKIILGSIIGVLIGTLMSVSYAFFTYANTSGTNSSLVTGNIWMKYGETNTLTLENAMPSNTYDSTHKFEFTIEGANTTTDKDVWYEIIAKRGNVPDGKAEKNRLQDKYIKFTLTKQIGNGTIETVVDGESWEGLTAGKKIYVDKIDKNTSSTTTHKYVLYMWISNKVGIGTNTTYTISQWNDLFASIKVDVNGDFTEKTADEPYMTVNTMNTFPTVITNQKSNIKEVYFNRMKEDAMQTAYNNASIKADLTYNNEGKVLAWLETNTTDNTKYNLIVASDGDTYLTTGDALFDGWSNMEKIEFNNINTSRVTQMDIMFRDCNKINNLNLSTFNTNNLTSMGSAFMNCNNLVNLNLDNWNLKSQLYGLFYGASNLKVLSCKNWVIPNNFDNSFFRGMSGYATKIETIDVTGWNLSNTENISALFAGGSLLSNLVGIDTWDLSNVTNLTDMFSGCNSLSNQTLYARTQADADILNNSSNKPSGLTFIVAS